MVIVPRRALTDAFAVARNLSETDVDPPGVSAPAFLDMADRLLQARI